MEFLRAIPPAEFDQFVLKHPTKSHFMQSAAWGEFNKIQRGYTPHYVGLHDDAGALCAAALLLERRPPLFPPYLYAPRGYVVDFFNEQLLSEMTKGVRAFAKERGAMFVAMDPDIELWEIDENGAHVADGFDNHPLVERLCAMGYRHRGYNKGFEGRQPRYTFRIDLARPLPEIEKGIGGNFMKNVRKSHNYALQIERGTVADIPDLYRLIKLTGQRDNFVGYDEDYYRNFFEILQQNGMATLWIGSADPAATVEMLRAERADLLKKRETLKKPGPIEESNLSEQRLDREIALFENYAKEFPNGARCAAHLVVRYGDKAWAVHAGSDSRMSETFLNNRVYYEKLRAAKEEGALLLDQFGTIGDPKHSPLRSLHEFKRQFGGRYVEFMGEFDLVLRPMWFFLYEKLLPFYRSARISLRMWLRKK